MRVALGADHGGALRRDGLLRGLGDGEADRGIVVCGSGIDASVAATTA